MVLDFLNRKKEPEALKEPNATQQLLQSVMNGDNLDLKIQLRKHAAEQLFQQSYIDELMGRGILINRTEGNNKPTKFSSPNKVEISIEPTRSGEVVKRNGRYVVMVKCRNSGTPKIFVLMDDEEMEEYPLPAKLEDAQLEIRGVTESVITRFLTTSPSN